MGIIVGSITYVKCDNGDCNNRTIGSYDQHKARSDATNAGWLISEKNGDATCPCCRSW